MTPEQSELVVRLSVMSCFVLFFLGAVGSFALRGLYGELKGRRDDAPGTDL